MIQIAIEVKLFYSNAGDTNLRITNSCTNYIRIINIPKFSDLY